MTAGVACRSCGTRLQGSAKFCGECGTPTAAPADTAKYKQVTVLFADVVRSMDIAATVDIERLREIMTELVERSASVVRRFGGTVEYNGDGVMALFGAPVALEDHAFRGCLAALAIQEEAGRLATEVRRRDGVGLQLRVGLNSGQVIAGEIGSSSLGYAATGQPVGLAERIESVTPPGEVMLSESTARLVEHIVLLAEPEWVRIKGVDEPVLARRLLAITPPDGLFRKADASLVGRRWEMAALDAMVERAIGGRGGVVTVVGPPGIGKSRVAREVAALAANSEIEVFWTFCESHARDVPFHAVTRMLRAAMGVSDLDDESARSRVRTTVLPNADPQDLLLLDDLLGISDPDLPVTQIDPDARRRRLTALINTASLARTRPALFIIEDAHWIDPISESMLADFLTVIPRTSAMVLVTSRPEYEGSLTRVHGAQTIALAPLGDSDTETLLGELLGSDPSITELTATITDRAAGNPFFAEEMVRELVQRGALTGERGGYVCSAGVAELRVPATVQAAIGARIDRLTGPARQTLHAASVIGARFEAELLGALGFDPVVDELLGAELIDQVRFSPGAEYAFHHPLIRTVAYESQLKSDRAGYHRRLATAIQESAPGSVEENAALIAEHLHAADDLQAAYDWHMRASAWSADRDINAARAGWLRAGRIADELAAEDPARVPMRIAPRTMLCATAWQASGVQESRGRFAELRELCNAAGDNVSLAIGMSGLATELLFAGQSLEGSRLSSEQMALLESIGDPTLTVGLAFIAFSNWFAHGEFDEISRWSQTVIDLAAGDPAMGAGFGMGSPLAIAVAFRGLGRWWLGLPGWRQDLHDAVVMARASDPATLGVVVTWTYGPAIAYGVLPADDPAVCVIEEAVQAARRASSDIALLFTEYTLSRVLLTRDAAVDRERGMELLAQAQEWQRERMPILVPVTEVSAGRERARRGDLDAAIPLMRRGVDELHQSGQLGYGIFAIAALVEALLERGTEADLAEADGLLDRLANPLAHEGSAIRDITVLHLRALLARSRGDDVAYQNFAQHYRSLAESLGFQGHIAMAQEMR